MASSPWTVPTGCTSSPITRSRTSTTSTTSTILALRPSNASLSIREVPRRSRCAAHFHPARARSLRGDRRGQHRRLDRGPRRPLRRQLDHQGAPQSSLPSASTAEPTPRASHPSSPRWRRSRTPTRPRPVTRTRSRPSISRADPTTSRSHGSRGWPSAAVRRRRATTLMRVRSERTALD